MEFTRTSMFKSIIFVIFFMWIFTASHTLATTVGEIAQGLTCTCGCNMVVGACEGSMECTVAKQITGEVSNLLAKGQTKDEIIRYFVEKNGERILAAPTKRGFNLTAWIMPFLALILGGGGVYFFLSRCLNDRRSNLDESKFSDKEKMPDKKYLNQFENELKDFKF